MRILAGAALLMALAGQAWAAIDITLLGDEHRGAIMRELAAREHSEIVSRGGVREMMVESAGVVLRSTATGEGAATLADVLRETDIALMVVDSTRGPTPELREHVLVARQARVPMIALLLTNVERLYERAPDEAGELLALETEEVRAVLSAYELDGDGIRVFLDAVPPDASGDIAASGIRETLLALARFSPRRASPRDMDDVREFWGAVYLLTDEETDGLAVTLSPGATITIWSEGTRSAATLRSASAYHPGEFREMPLAAEDPLHGVEGSRILLLHEDRVVGLGVITEIAPAETPGAN